MLLKYGWSDISPHRGAPEYIPSATRPSSTISRSIAEKQASNPYVFINASEILLSNIPIDAVGLQRCKFIKDFAEKEE